jgi:hypothetical protein
MISKEEFVFGNRAALIAARDRVRRLRAIGPPQPSRLAEMTLRRELVAIREEEERLRKARR